MADPTYKFTGVNTAQLENEVRLLRQNSSSGVPRLDRYRTLAAGSLIVLSLLSFPTDGHAQQVQASQPQGSAVPTLEALPHQPLPRGEFKGWCGLSDNILMITGQGIQIYNSDGVAATTHFFSEHVKLECGDDGRRMVRIDNHEGHAAEYDIASGDFTRLLASYASSQGKSFSPTISFSPDLKSVATDGPLTLGPGVTDLKVIQLEHGAHFIQWTRDSSEFLAVSRLKGNPERHVVEVFNAQGQKIGSGAVPAGYFFGDGRFGRFAGPQTLYLRVALLRDEFGADDVLKCRIQNGRCEKIAGNVLEASAGENGLLGMVRPVGKYSNTGEVITLPPKYLVELRNGASRVLARQTLEFAERNYVKLDVAPSGTKAVLSWSSSSGPGCPPKDRKDGWCRGGMIIDLTGVLK
jgi:hypothetical protein